MANIKYTRAFQHEDWIDNEDVVQAGGEKGFNQKFHDLEAEFDNLSNIIGLINASLIITSPTQTLTFAPSFFPNLNAPQWSQNNGLAVKAAAQTGADGFMPLQLPDEFKLQSMTAIGEKSGNVGSFIVQLVRQSITGALTTLLTLSLAASPDQFQVTDAIPPGFSLIDNKTNKYLIIARVIGADAAATVKLSAFQILCSRT
jgi:hypothetical protein